MQTHARGHMKFQIGDRVKRAREEMKLKQHEVATLIGMTQQGYQDIEAGEVQHPRKIEKLAQILKKPKEYLLFGTPIYDLNNPIAPQRKIPIIPWKDIMHWDRMRSLYSEKEPEDYVINFGGFGEKCFALKVQGDSMKYSSSQKNFNEGDVIIVDPAKQAEPGKYVVYTEKDSDAASFKQYVLDGNKKFLKPLNPQYPVMPLDENIVIRGVVVAHLDANL
jgi:SOS-response transcriptional repressor LexA